MTNYEIRSAIFEAGLRHWQVAFKVGMTSESFSRLLRYELSDERKAEILNAINQLKSETH